MQYRRVVFSGHMIDTAVRGRPRFPEHAVAEARSAICTALRKELEQADEVRGIAGAACGGDILFHESCDWLGIESEMCLALPPDEYIDAAVAPAGHEWVERFVRLANKHPLRVLPAMRMNARSGPEDERGVWQQCNEWMLELALCQGPQFATVMALWDGESGQDAGGTGDMLKLARRSGAKMVVLETTKIYSLQPEG